jgi:hypothetical protein
MTEKGQSCRELILVDDAIVVKVKILENCCNLLLTTVEKLVKVLFVQSE